MLPNRPRNPLAFPATALPALLLSMALLLLAQSAPAQKILRLDGATCQGDLAALGQLTGGAATPQSGARRLVARCVAHGMTLIPPTAPAIRIGRLEWTPGAFEALGRGQVPQNLRLTLDDAVLLLPPQNGRLQAMLADAGIIDNPFDGTLALTPGNGSLLLSFENGARISLTLEISAAGPQGPGNLKALELRLSPGRSQPNPLLGAIMAAVQANNPAHDIPALQAIARDFTRARLAGPLGPDGLKEALELIEDMPRPMLPLHIAIDAPRGLAPLRLLGLAGGRHPEALFSDLTLAFRYGN